MRNFRNLEIWQLGMDLLVMTYQLTERLPLSEQFGLRHQLRKSSVSTPSNIAEGCSRKSNREFRRFLEIALGSAFEIETQFLGAQQIGFYELSELTDVFELINKEQRKINKFMGRLSV